MEHEIPTLESLLRDGGATSVRVSFGLDVFATFEFDRDEGCDVGWNVFDATRRYPRQIAASLSFEDAARFSSQFVAAPVARLDPPSPLRGSGGRATLRGSSNDGEE